MDEADGAGGPLHADRPPLPHETSLPGVFAAGDVRRGSVKRVASAVGDGAATIPDVYRYLEAISACRNRGAVTQWTASTFAANRGRQSAEPPDRANRRRPASGLWYPACAGS